MELKKEDISQIKQQIDSKNSIFLDRRFLESLGPPITIVGRNKQAKKLLEFLYPCDGRIIAPFVSVYGKSGTGKSTVVKYVCDNLSDSASYIFVNLRKAKTNFGCANLILEELGCTYKKSHEGINHAIDEIESKIHETLALEKKKNFIMILDEFDAIFSDIRSRPTDFVYKLLNLVERLRTCGSNLCIVAISNSSLYDYSLDDRVRSRMDSYEVFFAPYTAQEILQILQDRAQKAFVKKPSDKVLATCATYCSSESGDCRRALQLLRLAGDFAKGEEITLSDLKKTYGRLESDNLDEILSTVTEHQRILLASVALVRLFEKKDFFSTTEIYSRYEGLCTEFKQNSLSYRRVFDLLDDLENTGIIICRTHSTGRHGYHNFYKLTCDYNKVGLAINKEWWSTIQEKKFRLEQMENMRHLPGMKVFRPYPHAFKSAIERLRAGKLSL